MLASTNTALPARSHPSSWLLRRRWVIEVGVQGEALGQFRAALPAEDARGFLDPVCLGFNGNRNLFVLLERQWLAELEHAVFIDGFNGNGHVRTLNGS